MTKTVQVVDKAAVQAIVDGLGLPPNRGPVPMSVWGRDHYSTFAYLETRVVDYKGTIAKQHMRTDENRHPGLAFRLPFSGDDPNEERYPTKLVGFVKLRDHDDWDCVDDMVVAGLIEKHGTGLYPIVKLTEQGELVAAVLRAHKGKGGNFCDFRFGG